MRTVKEDNPVFEVGTWVGRRQAFGLIANKSSAADAECLKQIRESKRYKSVGATWEEFCPRYLGLSRAHADKIIQQLTEFGSAYFALSQLVRIPEQAYRDISGAVSGESIEYNGEKIPISKENAHRIVDVITQLRQESEQLSDRRQPAQARLKSAQRQDPRLIRKRRRRVADRIRSRKARAACSNRVRAVEVNHYAALANPSFDESTTRCLP